jgi:hypothetical protein
VVGVERDDESDRLLGTLDTLDDLVEIRGRDGL